MYWSEFKKGNKTLSFELYFSSLRQKLGKISDNCKKKAKKLGEKIRGLAPTFEKFS